MTSDQEAVCGTCGVYRVRIDKSCPHCGADFIPPPVVPSDDRLPVLCVKVQGTGATWVCNRPSYDVVHQNVNNARPGSGKHDFKPPAPPTPLTGCRR